MKTKKTKKAVVFESSNELLIDQIFDIQQKIIKTIRYGGGRLSVKICRTEKGKFKVFKDLTLSDKGNINNQDEP